MVRSISTLANDCIINYNTTNVKIKTCIAFPMINGRS